MKTKDKSKKNTSDSKKPTKVRVRSMEEVPDKKYANLSAIEKKKKHSRNSQQNLSKNHTELTSDSKKSQNKKGFISKTIEIEKPKPIKAKETEKEKTTQKIKRLHKPTHTVVKESKAKKIPKPERTNRYEKTENRKNAVTKKMYYDNADDEGDYYYNHFLQKKLHGNLEVGSKNKDNNSHLYDIFNDIDDEDIEKEMDRIFSKGNESKKDLTKKKGEKKVDKKAENKRPNTKVDNKNKKNLKNIKTDMYKENMKDKKNEEQKTKNNSKNADIRWPTELNYRNDREEDDGEESEEEILYKYKPRKIEKKEEKKVPQNVKKNDKNIYIQQQNINIYYKNDKKEDKYPKEDKYSKGDSYLKEDVRPKTEGNQKEDSYLKEDLNPKENSFLKDNEYHEEEDVQKERGLLKTVDSKKNYNDRKVKFNGKNSDYEDNLIDYDEKNNYLDNLAKKYNIKDDGNNQERELNISLSNSIKKNLYSNTESKEEKKEQSGKKERKAYLNFIQNLKKANKNKENKSKNLFEVDPKIKLIKAVKKMNILNRALFNNYNKTHSGVLRDSKKKEEENLKTKKRSNTTYESYKEDIIDDYNGLILLKQNQGVNVFQIKLEGTLEEINKLFKNNKIEINGEKVELIYSKELEKLRKKSELYDNEKTVRFNNNDSFSDIEPKAESLRLSKKKTIQSDSGQMMLENIKIKAMKERIRRYKKELKKDGNEESMTIRNLRFSSRIKPTSSVEQRLKDMLKKLDSQDIRSSKNIKKKGTNLSKFYMTRLIKDTIDKKQLNTINENSVRKEKMDEKERKEKSYSRAMDRFKKKYRKDNSAEPRTNKSERINEMAKRLENAMNKQSGDNRYESKERLRENNFEEIIESKPIHKKIKKKKLQKFEL